MLWRGMAAAGLWITGEIMRFIPATGGVGDALSGTGQLLVGTAALAAALTALRTNKEAKNIAAAVGPLPENGDTLHDVVDRIDKFESYQHVRNHDILNGINVSRNSVPVVITFLERIEAKIDLLSPEEAP